MKIVLNKYKWTTNKILSGLDREKLGIELSEKLAVKLKEIGWMYNTHRDYCGHGLEYKDGMYRLMEVHDGNPDPRIGDLWIEWSSEAEFIEFFSNQSDWTMSGMDEESKIFKAQNEHRLNNQRLTKQRIINFIHDHDYQTD